MGEERGFSELCFGDVVRWGEGEGEGEGLTFRGEIQLAFVTGGASSWLGHLATLRGLVAIWIVCRRLCSGWSLVGSRLT